MRKYIFLLLLTISIVCNANVGNKIAVLDFLAGSGTTQTNVEGMSAIFITYFNPSKCELIERTQVDNIIKEQNFQLTNLTAQDIAKIGKIGNINYLVMGDVNVINGVYNVDIRVVSCETGKIIASTGDELEGGMSFRSLIKNLANTLSQSLDSKLGETIRIQEEQVKNDGLDCNVMGFYLGMPYDNAISLLTEIGCQIPSISEGALCEGSQDLFYCRSLNAGAYAYAPNYKFLSIQFFHDYSFENVSWSELSIDFKDNMVSEIMLRNCPWGNESSFQFMLNSLRRNFTEKYYKYLITNQIWGQEFNCVFKDNHISIRIGYGRNCCYVLSFENQ